MIRISQFNKPQIRFIKESLAREVPLGVDKWVKTVLNKQSVKAATQEQVTILTVVARYFRRIKNINNKCGIFEKIFDALKYNPFFKIK
ncbi:MAG: hypothetical protein PHX18_05745 [Candidatus Gastranaerophilales bacterium]|nr:hypothetical protein [Candidatus Gastranaerophilales bacterium]